MENTEFTKQLADNPLIKNLIDLSVESQVQLQLIMSFMTEKHSASKDERMAFFSEFLEFQEKHRPKLREHVTQNFIEKYLAS